MRLTKIENFPFHPAITRWFSNQFSAPSPPQMKGWPVIAAGKHTLVLAPTGSGKTLAAFLYCIDELFRLGLKANSETFFRNPNGIHTLYISPLKALNNDIHHNLQEPLKGIRREARVLGVEPPDIRVLVRTGDTPQHVRQSMVRRPPHILITTPESLYLLLTSPRGREMFRNLRYLIVDEIHALSNNKRGVHLSLSLERLMALCQNEPVRIGLSATQRPLKRIASFLGGQLFSEQRNEYMPRPVTIVDCGQRKDMDLQVLAPVENFSDLPEASVWPAVIEKLYDLIRAHRTTLVFVNMRAQTEKIARQLNELHRKITGNPEAKFALPHHGSLSREERYTIEAWLKAEEIPAVIATASLELGIDIGSIDLVVQLESPRSVTGALQRVGRSGHLLQATSKGRIIPLYPADLDDAVAMTRCMKHGDIEETVVPENCLDVLAQQIVAEVAMQQWSRQELYRLVRQSYCYRNLTITAFDHVLEMLSGRFAESPLRALKPRITWDRVNDQLIPRRGARLLATMNAGTIPDRGYFGVYLADSNTKLGEMEEEFVFESRVGDVFFLGSNEWRIHQITHDRIFVLPVKSIKPRAPFWKGDSLSRDFSTSIKIAAFRRELLEKMDRGECDSWLISNFGSDEAIAKSLKQYFQRQQTHTGIVPTDKQLLGEWFCDRVDEPHFILHAPFGARVNGIWAIAIAAALEKQFHLQVQYAFDDNGIIIRLLDTNEPPPMADILKLSTDEIEKLLMEALVDSPIFAVRFRYNAMRALLLPRSQPHKRLPLWLQRLRAADLLQVVRQFPDFPIVVETYRDCLEDVFDLPALRKVLDRLQRGEIRIQFVQTPYPSPMASGLIFRFLASNLYEDDHTRMTSQATSISSEFLAEILSRENIPTVVTPEIIEIAEAHWQHRSLETQAVDAEDLFAIIEKLGPIQVEELKERAKIDPVPWLKQLRDANRIVYIQGKYCGWMARTDAPLFSDKYTNDQASTLVRRYLRVHGPVTLTEIQKALDLPEDILKQILADLYKERELVCGKLVVGVKSEQWCNRQNFAELYHRAIAVRREVLQSANREIFYRFLLHWHRLGMEGQSMQELIKRYSGFCLPPYIFERELLRSRMCVRDIKKMPELMEQLSGLIARGEVIVRANRNSEEGRRNVGFILRGEGHLFSRKADLLDVAQRLEDPANTVFDFLQENGASLVRDVVAGTGLSTTQVNDGLSTLTNHGLASCDNYQTFMLMLQHKSVEIKKENNDPWLQVAGPDWRIRGQRRRQRQSIRKTVLESIQLHEGRWFLTISFAVLGKEMDEATRAERQARMLLQRYGILVKEWYRREHGLLPWYQLFHILKRMEWQDEVRRGYFIEGLSGIQFALPEAVELLEKLQSESKPMPLPPLLISTIDPVLPFGGAFDWDLHDSRGNKITVIRSASNHLIFLDDRPVLYSENFGTRLWTLINLTEEATNSVATVMKSWLQLPQILRPRKRIEILHINETPATGSPLAKNFLQNGFERDGKKLVLWPSGI